MLNQKPQAMLLIGLLTGSALGQTAGMLAFQGVIRDDQGAALNSPVDLTFRVFDAEVAGNQVDIAGHRIAVADRHMAQGERTVGNRLQRLEKLANPVVRSVHLVDEQHVRNVVRIE